MNRAERRKAMKEVPGWMKQLQSEDKAYQQMVRNGITQKDLDEAKKQGFYEGLDAGKQISVRTIYAAALLTLNEEFGFGKQRALKFLKVLDEKVCFTVDTDEVIDSIFEKFGFGIKFKGYDAIDGRIEQKDV